MQGSFRPLFPCQDQSKLSPRWHTLDELPALCVDPPVFLLGSGSIAFLEELPRDCLTKCAGCLFAVDVDFARFHRSRDLLRQLQTWRRCLLDFGLGTVILSHAAFGGVTNAEFLVGYKGLHLETLKPTDGLARTLGHIINPASAGHFPRLDVPPPVHNCGRTPVVIDGLSRKEGLFDVHSPDLEIACPSVFSPSWWVRRRLTRTEHFRMWDIPMTLERCMSDDSWIKWISRRSFDMNGRYNGGGKLHRWRIQGHSLKRPAYSDKSSPSR